MSPDPRFRSVPMRESVTGTARSEAAFARPDSVTSLLPGSITPFSQVAGEHGVTPAAMDGLLEQLPVGLLVVDRDGGVVYANEVARGMRVEQLEPLQWAVTRALLTEDAVRENEIEIVAPGHPRRWLSAHVMPVRVTGRGVTGAFVALSDVTAKRRMRAWDPVIETLVNL